MPVGVIDSDISTLSISFKIASASAKLAPVSITAWVTESLPFRSSGFEEKNHQLLGWAKHLW